MYKKSAARLSELQQHEPEWAWVKRTKCARLLATLGGAVPCQGFQVV